MANPSSADLEIISVAGYAGDRTVEGIESVEILASGLSDKFRVGHTALSCGPATMPDANTVPEVMAASKPTLDLTANAIAQCLDSGSTPILVTSRCATALASVPKVLSRSPAAVVLWFDAHGDLNTPATSSTGYLGGMSLSGVLGEWDSGFGHGLTADRVVLIGARDLDPPELAYIKRTGLVALPELNGDKELSQVEDMISGKSVYIHLDVDCYDPAIAAAEYKVPGGLSAEAIRSVMEVAASRSTILGIEIAEFLPHDEADSLKTLESISHALEPVFDEYW